MKNLVLVFVAGLSIAACGGKSNSSTTPTNTGSTMGSGATGGATYGGATGSGSAAAPMPMKGGAGGDPCGG